MIVCMPTLQRKGKGDGGGGGRHCSNTENRVKVVVVVFFNMRDKGSNLGDFFFGGGGGGCAVYFPANTTHEKSKVGSAHFFSRAFAFSYEFALSLPFDNAEVWMGSFFACFFLSSALPFSFLFISSFFFFLVDRSW